MTEQMTADIEITGLHEPTHRNEDNKFIIYYRGKNSDTGNDVYGMLYLEATEMSKLRMPILS